MSSTKNGKKTTRPTRPRNQFCIEFVQLLHGAQLVWTARQQHIAFPGLIGQPWPGLVPKWMISWHQAAMEPYQDVKTSFPQHFDQFHPSRIGIDWSRLFDRKRIWNIAPMKPVATTRTTTGTTATNRKNELSLLSIHVGHQPGQLSVDTMSTHIQAPSNLLFKNWIASSVVLQSHVKMPLLGTLMDTMGEHRWKQHCDLRKLSGFVLQLACVPNSNCWWSSYFPWRSRAPSRSNPRCWISRLPPPLQLLYAIGLRDENYDLNDMFRKWCPSQIASKKVDFDISTLNSTLYTNTHQQNHVCHKAVERNNVMWTYTSMNSSPTILQVCTNGFEIVYTFPGPFKFSFLFIKMFFWNSKGAFLPLFFLVMHGESRHTLWTGQQAQRLHHRCDCLNSADKRMCQNFSCAAHVFSCSDQASELWCPAEAMLQRTCVLVQKASVLAAAHGPLQACWCRSSGLAEEVPYIHINWQTSSRLSWQTRTITCARMIWYDLLCLIQHT